MVNDSGDSSPTIATMELDEEKTSFGDLHRLLEDDMVSLRRPRRYHIRCAPCLTIANGLMLLVIAVLLITHTSNLLKYNETIKSKTDGLHFLRAETAIDQFLTILEFTRDAVKMELRPFDDIFNWHQGAFRGDPRPELNEAWRSMVHGIVNIHLFVFNFEQALQDTIHECPHPYGCQIHHPTTPWLNWPMARAITMLCSPYCMNCIVWSELLQSRLCLAKLPRKQCESICFRKIILTSMKCSSQIQERKSGYILITALMCKYF